VARPAAAVAGVPSLLDRIRSARTPLLLVLSGPSGVGKDAVLAQLATLHPHLSRVVTFTTRPRRPGEAADVDYHFVSTETFLAMRERGEFLETAEILGQHYGTPVEPLRVALAAGRDVVLKIDTQGALQVRRRVPAAVLVFLAPPSLESLVERLQRRQAWGPGEVEARVERARAELAEVRYYDYVVLNPDRHPEEAAANIRAIVLAEKLRVHPRQVKL